MQNFTDRSESLSTYLSEINRYKLMTREQEAAVATRIKEGDESAVDELVRANLRFVVSIAKTYANQGVPLEDLISEGNIGLIKAAHRFDVDRGYKFISYAVWWVRQSILTALSQTSRIVRVPLNRAGTLHRIGQASRLLYQKLGREPSTEEIAKHLGLPEKEVEDTRSISNTYVSIHDPYNDDPDGSAFVDYLVDEKTAPPDKDTYLNLLSSGMQRALETLTDREQQIMRLYFGLDGSEPLTLEEIGGRLSLTRERIRQIKEKAVERMRHAHRAKFIEGFLEN